MKQILKRASDYLLIGSGIALLTLAFSSFPQSANAQFQGTCKMNPPRNCSWEVIDSYCDHVGACSSDSCFCIDTSFGHPGCCYVEIGTINEGYPCMAQGCTTFKKCCLGSCHS